MDEPLCLGRVLQVSGGPEEEHQEPGGCSLSVFQRNGNGEHMAGETQWMHQRWSLVLPVGANRVSEQEERCK